MATAKTTDVIEALRYTYADPEQILYLFNQEVPLWNVLSKVKKPLGGRGQFLMPIMVQNPGAWKGITQGGAYPTALNPDTAEASWSLIEQLGVYELSYKLIQDARSSKFAFKQAIQLMDEGLKRRIFRLINADLLGYGRGELAILGAADNVDPITSRFLPRAEVGMVVDFMDASDDDTKLLDSRTITAVDPIARTVTLGTNAAGTAAGDYITWEDTSDISVNATALHMFGLLRLIDDANHATSVVGNPGNIDRSVAGNEYWESVVLDNSGTNRPLTEDLMLKAEDSVREKGGGRLTNWFMNLNIGRRYHELLRADTIATMGRVSPIAGGLGREGGEAREDGRSPYDFSGVAVHFDPFFEANTVVGFDKAHFFIGTGENEMPRPISEIFDNVPFFHETDNAAFQVRWYWQSQLVTDNPAAGVKIEDVAES
jgi:hypothetical protein